ncbi:MAG: TetR/AcrR family transcriptional regulator [Verrucomicrobia bacterium]|nr:TetR/AcrR family transcriptional regulator [Verrucomicrobiota bacterium]
MQPPRNDPRARILERATELLRRHGCRALTMELLARELGVSKKTLYAVVPSKEALVEAMIRRFVGELRSSLEAVLEVPGTDYSRRKEEFFATVFGALGRLPPQVFQDIDREYPSLRQRIEAIRGELLPTMLGRLLRLGAAEDKVRADVDPAFFCTVFLAGVNALLRAETLDRFRLHPAEMAARLAKLLFDGIATRPTRTRKSSA